MKILLGDVEQLINSETELIHYIIVNTNTTEFVLILTNFYLYSVYL